MSFLLDTPVIFEVIRPEPNLDVQEWLQETQDSAIHLSVLTIGEITQAVSELTDKKRQGEIRLWLKHDLLDWLGDRILPIDDVTATIWGNMNNLPITNFSTVDLLLAATAIKYDLTLVTPNDKFQEIDAIHVLNPYKVEETN